MSDYRLLNPNSSTSKQNPSRAVCAVDLTWQDVPYFSSFIAKSCMSDLEDIGQGQRSRGTPPHASGHLCQIWKESIQNCMCCRAGTTRCDIFKQFYCKVIAEWHWRYRSRSKVIVHGTLSHAGDHLCLIWKEDIQNCSHYSTGMACGTDGQMDRRTEWNQYPPPH